MRTPARIKIPKAQSPLRFRVLDSDVSCIQKIVRPISIMFAWAEFPEINSLCVFEKSVV
jgi:hypothetical protein